MKYKTREIKAKFNDETFSLLNQGGHPEGRYKFLKDIQRLEKIVSNNNKTIGYCIFLTNDESYWKKSNRDSVGKKFNIHAGREIRGMLSWGEGAGNWVKKVGGKFKLDGIYNLCWKDYSKGFKYLLVEVNKYIYYKTFLEIQYAPLLPQQIIHLRKLSPQI